ncbi:polysaccharide biosynthesis tyrosine autokinase [Microlunatus lacustris]
MELRDYLEILRRRWLGATVVALAVLATASALTLLSTPQYTATTRLFFSVQGSESVTDLAQGSTFAEKQMTSYAEVATSPLVLNPVIRDLRLDTAADLLAGSITTTVPSDTVILEVSAVDPDPARARDVANAVGNELSEVAATLVPEREDGSDAVQATILAPALLPSSPSSPDVLRNLAVALALGLILGAGFALLRHVLDTKVRNDQDVRALTDQPLLGAIAFDDAVPTHPVMVTDQPHSAPAEAIRRLRTNLQFVGVASGSKSVVITSSIPGEGKSTTAINLAVSLADAGTRVVLVDADLRRPSVAGYLGLEGRAGLTSVLIGRAEVEDVIQPWRESGLDVLPSGPVPPNPSELLGSAAMRDLLTKLEASYDVVLLDTPPLLPVTDATILTKLAGGALVIVGADRIHKAQLAESLETLETADAQLHGLVLNKIARRDSRPYVYENGYYSSEMSEEEAHVPAAAVVPAHAPDQHASPAPPTATPQAGPAAETPTVERPVVEEPHPRNVGATAILNGRKRS